MFRLEADIFAATPAVGAQKVLKASTFKAIEGNAKADKDDRILYDKKTGDLFHDRDGSGAAFKAIKVAEIDNGAIPTAADFLVV